MATETEYISGQVYIQSKHIRAFQKIFEDISCEPTAELVGKEDEKIMTYAIRGWISTIDDSIEKWIKATGRMSKFIARDSYIFSTLHRRNWMVSFAISKFSPDGQICEKILRFEEGTEEANAFAALKERR